MSNRQILASIKKRCIALRIETRELCALAGVSYVTLWRWGKNPGQMTMAKVRALEDKLSELEQKAKEGAV
jgi:predicted site-specific integrase-resolvase